MGTANAAPTGEAIRQARWRWSLTRRAVSGTIVGIAVEIAPLSCSNMAFCLRRSISAQDANDPVTAVECASASEDLMDVLTIART